LFAARNIQLPKNINGRVNYDMKTTQDIIIEQLESEIQSLKLEKISSNNECMDMVRQLTDEIRDLKKNLRVVESILRSSFPIVDADNYID
jgi:hypothetical protein